MSVMPNGKLGFLVASELAIIFYIIHTQDCFNKFIKMGDFFVNNCSIKGETDVDRKKNIGLIGPQAKVPTLMAIHETICHLGEINGHAISDPFDLLGDNLTKECKSSHNASLRDNGLSRSTTETPYRFKLLNYSACISSYELEEQRLLHHLHCVAVNNRSSILTHLRQYREPRL